MSWKSSPSYFQRFTRSGLQKYSCCTPSKSEWDVPGVLHEEKHVISRHILSASRFPGFSGWFFHFSDRSAARSRDEPDQALFLSSCRLVLYVPLSGCLHTIWQGLWQDRRTVFDSCVAGYIDPIQIVVIVSALTAGWTVANSGSRV